MKPEIGGARPQDVEKHTGGHPVPTNSILREVEGQPGPEQEELTWVRPREAAERAGVSPSTIYNWVRDGHVQAEDRPVKIPIQIVVTRNILHVPLEQIFAYKDVPKAKGGRPPKTP